MAKTLTVAKLYYNDGIFGRAMRRDHLPKYKNRSLISGTMNSHSARTEMVAILYIDAEAAAVEPNGHGCATPRDVGAANVIAGAKRKDHRHGGDQTRRHGQGRRGPIHHAPVRHPGEVHQDGGGADDLIPFDPAAYVDTLFE